MRAVKSRLIHPDREIVFYLIEGTIELELGDETRELSARDIVRFDGDQEIAPHAVEGSTALIVLASRSDSSQRRVVWPGLLWFPQPCASTPVRQASR